jgi:hypothetical protein
MKFSGCELESNWMFVLNIRNPETLQHVLGNMSAQRVQHLCLQYKCWATVDNTVCPPLVLTQMSATLRYFATLQIYATALEPRSEVWVFRMTPVCKSILGIIPVCKSTHSKVLKVTFLSFLDSISVARWEWAQVDERVSDPRTCMRGR